MFIASGGVPIGKMVSISHRNLILAPVVGAGGETLITIVLAILLIAVLFTLIMLYRVPGIGKSGKNKFLAYTGFAIFVIILGIAGMAFSSRLPFIGEFGALIGLVSVVITLILGALIYITYRNEMDFAREIELAGKDLQQKGDDIETTVKGMLSKVSQREEESQKREERVEKLLEDYKKGKE
ncbi:MAG: hypothetical protein PVF58_13995 [Candidatus Methanofastidiosia archaeon]|jgi:hypothetical protein